MPDAPKLQRIEMADNRLAGSELKNLLKFPELKVIKFGANLVKELDEIRVLAPLTYLMDLDFNENPVANLPNYKEEIFKMFPELIILDGKDKDGNDALSDDEEDDNGDDWDN